VRSPKKPYDILSFPVEMGSIGVEKLSRRIFMPKVESRTVKTTTKTKTGSLSQITTDHNIIQRWAEDRGAKPGSVKSTGGSDIGVLRLMFPGYSEGRSQSLHEITWDDFFRKFDENELAFIYQDKTSRGDRSNFNKFIKKR
jgi:hypothetical protein